MPNTSAAVHLVGDKTIEKTVEQALLDAVFFALSDPVRREILERLSAQPQLVSELAAPFDMSLQAVSRHIQVLVRAGLVRQERSGRISRCSLEVGPVFAAAVWINRYSKYWQAQFDTLAGWLRANDGKPGTATPPERAARRAARPAAPSRTKGPKR